MRGGQSERSGMRGARAANLVVRHVSELGLSRGLRWQEATAPDRFDCLVLQTVMSANLGHLGYGEDCGIDAPDECRRPISVMAIARSMNLPYETVRRRVRVLIEAGLMRADGNGVVVPAAIFGRGAAARLPGQDAAALTMTLRRLADGGHAPSQAALATGVDALADTLLARLVMDFLIRVLESFTLLHGDVINGSISATIAAANVRHILTNPALAERFAASDQVPPDALRQPVGLRTVAREMHLPFETVRRRAATMIAQGRIEPLADGVIVPRRVILGEENRLNNLFITAQFERMTETIARLAR